MPIDYESQGFESAFKKDERLTGPGALAGNAVFNSGWLDLGPDKDGDGVEGLLVAAYVSTDAALGTLRIEGSDDGAAVADVIAQVATAQIGGAGSFKANAIGYSRHRYIRVTFNNGANPQAALLVDRILVA